MSRLSTIDWTVCLAYLGVIACLALRSVRGQRDNEDYFLGGRRMNWFAVGVSMFATSFSSISFLGLPQRGASVEFRIREGSITMLSLGVTGDGRFKFIMAEGESVRGPIPPTGNTNTRAFLRPDVRTALKRWVAEGPTHHFALGVGHHAETIAKIAEVLKVENVIIR